MNMLMAGRSGTQGTMNGKDAPFCGCSPKTTRHATVTMAYSDTANNVMVSILSLLIIQVFSETQRANMDSSMIVTVTFAIVLVYSVG